MFWRTASSTTRGTVGAVLASAALLGALALPVSAAAQTDGESIDTTPPTAPVITSGRQISRDEIRLIWDLSTDDDVVASYRFYRNGVLLDQTAPRDLSQPFESYGEPDSVADVAFDPPAVGGRAWMQITAVDPAGNESRRSAPLAVRYSTRRPAAPTEVTVDPGRYPTCVALSFTRSDDFRNLVGYEVLVNGLPKPVRLRADQERPDVLSGDVCGLGSGPRFIQVRATQFGGSARTAPVRVSIPRAPTGFTVVHEDGNAIFTWDRPDADIEALTITDTYAVVTRVPASSAEFVIPVQRSPFGNGKHFYQLRAISADGFESNRTAPVFIEEPVDRYDLTADYDRAARCLNFSYWTEPGIDVAEYRVLILSTPAVVDDGSSAAAPAERRSGQLCSDDDRQLTSVTIETVATDGSSTLSNTVYLPYGQRVRHPRDFSLTNDGPTLTFTWAEQFASDQLVSWTLFDTGIEIARFDGADITEYTIDIGPSRYGDDKHRFQLQGTDVFGRDTYKTPDLRFEYPDE